MSQPLSANSQAILLLTAPLLLGRGVSIERPLSAEEYAAFAAALHAHQRQPADCLGSEREAILAECQVGIEHERLRRLLARGFLLGQAIERWRGRGIWLLTRADPGYPRRLKARLCAEAPPVLYGCGDVRLLSGGGLAVFGARRVEPALGAYSEAVGKLLAVAGETCLFGGLRGIDRRAFDAALADRGRALIVLPDNLERVALERASRDAIADQRLLLVSPFDPGASYDTAHLAPRNRLLCGLSDALLVLQVDPHDDATWPVLRAQIALPNGARVFVDAHGYSTGAGTEQDLAELDPALTALLAHGALVWPGPTDASSLRSALREPPVKAE